MEGTTVRSFTARTGIRNNVTANVGPVRLGVTWLEPGPPPHARIAVMPNRSGSAGGIAEQVYDVPFGGTFPIGEETWRFVDITFRSATRWELVVERVEPDSPPWRSPPPAGSREWAPIKVRPFGELAEAQLRSLEERLGRALPPAYRSWLARTNGVQPIGEHHVPGLHLALFEERPLLGVHPEFEWFDLARVDELHRMPWLSDNYVVIALPSGGGLVAVRVREPGSDHVVFLPHTAKLGPRGDAANAARQTRLVTLAPDIESFLQRLQPLVLPE